jgi:hypothetical protein
LWKTTRKLKQPHHIPPLRLQNNTWARTDKQKATAFAHHFSTVFRPFPSQATTGEEEHILQELSSPYQMALPLKKKIGISEVQHIIQHKTNPTKAPGYNLITGAVIKELSQKGIRALTQIYNAILRLEYFPRYWKFGQIIMIVKPGKYPTEVTSYRPINLLPLLSKILKKILLRQMTPILKANHLIPNHHFGFRPQHGTIEQAHRLVRKIHEDLQIGCIR